MDSKGNSGLSKYTNLLSKVFGFAQAESEPKEEAKIESPATDLSIRSDEGLCRSPKIIKSLVLDFSNVLKDYKMQDLLPKAEIKIDVIDQ